MKYSHIKKLYRETDSYINKNIILAGWVKTLRSSKGIIFIELNDGTFFKNLQIICDENLENFAEIEKVSIGSSLEVEGLLIESPAAGQKFELKADKVSVISLAESNYPLQKKGHSFEFLREIAHLRPRSNTFAAVFRLRSVLSYAVHHFLKEEGFVYAHTPIISSSDCEGAGEMFNVSTFDLNKEIPKNDKGEIDHSKDYFATKTGLAVSGQLEAEAMIMALNKVYTFGPTFRAENSNTTKHASEFWMIEPEMAFADINEVISLSEKLIKYLIDYIFTEIPEEMEFFNKFIDNTLFDRLQALKNSDFKSLTYTEAIDILEKSNKKFVFPVSWGIDLQTEHERYLAEEFVKGPVFVTDYPKDIKAFYMRLNDDKKTVAAVDLLVPGIGEIIGGSQREERFDFLEKRIEEMGLPKEDYWWYLDLRRFGSVKHAGFGIGFERLIMYLSGMANIRDVIPFPRTPKNAQF